ncbi:MAG: hypothetical protein Q9168_006973 [Polycauliona sp. 1 TL-2023]
MIRSSSDVEGSDSEYPPGHETGFTWDHLAFYHVPPAGAGTDHSTVTSSSTGLTSPPYCLDKHDLLMQHLERVPPLWSPSELGAGGIRELGDGELQELGSGSHQLDTWTEGRAELPSPFYHCPELDSQMYGLNSFASSERRHKLQSSPMIECAELQSGQLQAEHWTGKSESTELHGNKPDHHQPLELMGSLPSYTDTQIACLSSNQHSTQNAFHPSSLWNLTPPSDFIGGSSFAESPPPYAGPTRHGPLSQPVDSVLSIFTPARQEGFSSTSATDAAFTRQSAPLDWPPYQKPNSFSSSSQLGQDQERVQAKARRTQGQSKSKTLLWHNFPQTNPLTDDNGGTARNIPPCSEALLRTMSTHRSIKSMPPADVPAQFVYPAYPESQVVVQDGDQQERIRPVSPLARSDTASPSSSIVSPLSSNGSRRAQQIYCKDGQSLIMKTHGSTSPPGSSSSSNRSSAKTSVSSSTTAITPTDGSPVSLKQSSFQDTTGTSKSKATGISHCPDCLRAFTGSFQDRKQNLKRHSEFNCPARDGPRERFGCSINGCTKEYSRPDNLAKHRQKQHQAVPALQRSNAHKVRRNF